MLEFNLTQRERQILVRLLELSGQSKDHFEVRLIDPAADGPGRELARLGFGDTGEFIEVTKRDLRLLKDEGLIHFRWGDADYGKGRLSSLAFAAVGSNFNAPDAAAAEILAANNIRLAIVADEQAIALRFSKITAELVNLTHHLIDADEAQSAQHEGAAIAAELGKAEPDEPALTRKTKSFVSRLSLTFSGTADLANKGEMIGEFGERLGAWLVALSVWTEWHANHHPQPDPCA